MKANTRSNRHPILFDAGLLALLTAALLGHATSDSWAQGEIVAWGKNNFGQCTVPSTNAEFTVVSAGANHSLGLKGDGTIVAWGLNDHGQCDVPSSNANFTDIAAGNSHSLGVKSDGTIVAWGLNDYGQCDLPSPNVDFLAVAAGGNHSLGLKTDGMIVAWGDGQGGLSNIPEPNADFVGVAAGLNHSLGLKSNGSIVAWGDNGSGQCDAPWDREMVFVAVAAGAEHSLGLRFDGSIVAWGWSEYGQCNVPEPNSGFLAVAAGAEHSMGLKADGSIVAWGHNELGQCLLPESNLGFSAIAAGGAHSLGLQSNARQQTEVHVGPRGSNIHGDGSQTRPFRTIRYGLLAAPLGGTVVAACGVYRENAIWLRPGVSLRSETGQADCVKIDAGVSVERGLYCFDIDDDVLIRGIEITNGRIGYASVAFDQYGGGLYASGSNLRFEDCRFSYNEAAGAGGVFMDNSSPTFIRTLFDHNSGGGGGAILCENGSNPAISYCTFVANSASDGGAIYGVTANMPPIANCTFVGNRGAVMGAAISGEGCIVVNSIFAFNESQEAGWGSVVYGATTLQCCDVFGNACGDYVDGIAGQQGINGNFSLDPLFADRGSGDLRLSLGSPCAPGATENGQCGLIGSCNLITRAGIRVRVIEGEPGGNVVPIIARIAGTATNFTPFVYIIDGYATFTDEVLTEFFGDNSQPEDRIERIEIMDNPHRVVGHIGFKYTHEQQHQGAGVDCFLFIHDGDQAAGAGQRNWEYYDEDEYPVTMLVPPGGDLEHVDGGDDWPVIFIHGVSGTHGYWENTPDSLPQDIVDSWEYCYPYDQDIGELAGYLRRVMPLLLDGQLVDVPAYQNRRAGLVTHSMGGLVVRQALRDDEFADGIEFADRIERVLMIAPPNHGSHLSWRMNIDDPNVTWFLAEFMEIMPNKDPDAPAYAQMSPASDFLNELNRNSVPSLAGRSVSQSYLVVAGIRDVSTYPKLHREIQSQDDGVVSASSASLTGWGIPLALVDQDHGGIHNSAPAKALMPWLWGGLQTAVDDVLGVLCLQQTEGADQCDDVPNLDTGLGMMTVTISDPPDNAQHYRLDGIVNGRLQLTMNGALDQVDSRRELRRTTSDGNGYFSLCSRFEYYGLDIRELAHWIPTGTYPVVLIEENRTSLSTDVIRIDHLSTAVDDIIRSPWSNLAYSAPSISSVPPTAIGIAAVYDWTVDTCVDTLVLSLSAENIDPQAMPDRMELIDPHGNVIDATVAGNSPNIDFVAESAQGPIRFAVRQPEPGAWKVRHAAELAGATLTAGVYSPVRMEVGLSPLEPAAGDSLALDVEVLGADTFPLRTVTAHVIRTPEGGIGTVDLGTLDFAWSTGNLWRRVLTDLDVGTYEIVVTLNGTDAESQTLTRDVTKSVWVGPAPSGASGISDDPRASDELPHELPLIVSPNPFNASTDIQFDLPRTQHVNLTIYAIDGRKVVSLANGVMEVGPHSITWRGVDGGGRPAASGVYFVVLRTADGQVTSKTALLK